MIVRKATLDDVKGIFEVYKESAKVHPESLTQYEDELTLDYIESEIKNALERGLVLVAVDNNKIIGSFKAYTSKYRKLAHVLTNATFTSLPTFDGKRGFVLLLKSFLEYIQLNCPHIYKLEGIPHESNSELVKYYLKFGFVIECNVQNEIFNTEKNTFEKQIVIYWLNSNFSMESLKKYQKYLGTLPNRV